MREIHITDLESFVSCRRRWDFESLMRRGLQRAALTPPLFLGQGVHIGLDSYYKAGQSRTAAIKAFRDWVDAREEEIEAFSGPLWAQERDTITELRNLGTMMLHHYGLWVPPFDEKYEVIATEQRFRVPVPIPQGTPLRTMRSEWKRSRYMHDGRMVAGHIEFAGRMDGIVRKVSDDTLYVLEFKTSRSLRNTAWIYKGIQGTAYVWAARQMYGDAVRGIVYRVLRKTEPRPPKPLMRGGYSVAKNQKTSFPFLRWWFEREAKEREVDPRELFREAEDLLRMFHARETPDGNDFFEERIIHKSDAQMANAMRAVYFVGSRMADPSVPIFARGGWANCNICPFQDPCSLLETGHAQAAAAVLESEYAPRTYWEDDDDETDD